MSDKNVSISEIELIVKESILSNTDQIAKQVAQAISQDVASGKFSFSANKEEEILGGESLRNGTINETRAWNHLIISDARRASDLKAKQEDLLLREREHQFKVQRELDEVKIRRAQNSETNDNQLRQEYAKFNAAVSEPLAPNTQDSGSDTKGGDQA